MKKNGLFTIRLAIATMVLFMLSPQLGMGQSTANYAYATHTTGSLTDMSSGTTDLLATGVFRQNAVSAVTDIGFTFYYMSTAYTQFSISSNGQMRLGPVPVSGINYATPRVSETVFAPMSGFNSIQTSGKVHYKVIGTAPNQVLVVEWVDFRIPILNAAGTFSKMQVLLYETTGKIEFVYGTMHNNSTWQTRTIFHSSSNIENTVGWLGGINTATPTYNTTATITQTSLVNNSAIANLTSAADGSRRVFSFTPPPGPPDATPTWAATPITNVTTAGMILNWNDIATNETSYLVQRSTDNITFNSIAILPADAITYTATGLTPSTLYYWKVGAVREAAEPLFTTVESMATPATSTFTSVATGNWSAASTWSTGMVPTATDDVVIDNAHTVTIDAPGLVAKSVTVNGALTYHETTVSGLTVSGDVIVNASGSFTSPASGTIITHTLYIGGSTATGVGGNLVVDGVFNMNAFSTAGVSVMFYGTPSNAISGVGTINFYSVGVYKGTTNASILDVSSVITCAEATSAAASRLSVTVGTLKLSSASTLTPWYGSLQVTAPNNARLWLDNSGATLKSVGAGTESAPAGTLSFGGLLQIDAGTLSHGNGASSISIFGHFSMGGPDATLNIYGSFGSGSGSNFTITAGNINIYPQVGANSVPSSYYSQGGLFRFGGSQLNFTGGTLTIFDPSLAVSSGSYYAPISIYITGGTNNLAGSTIRFGDGISDLEGSVNGFTISTGATVLGDVIVNSAPGSIKTTRIVKLAGHSTIGGLLTINSGAANQFLGNGFMLTLKGNVSNAGTFNVDVAAPGNTTSGLTFTGTSQQTVGGTGTFGTNVNNIIINNTSGANPAVDLQFPLSVSNSLTLTNGILGSSTSSVFTIGKAAYPTLSLTRSGGSLASAPTFDLGGVTTFNVSYLAPTPAASIVTGFELPAAVNITTFTVNNISGVTLDKAVGCTTLALTSGNLTTTSTNSITVTGTGAANITGGSATSYVNGPLIRTIPFNAAAANYKFPVGKTTYMLLEYSSITTGGAGNASFTVESFDAGPYAGTAGNGLSIINQDKYWSLSANLGSVTITSSNIRITEAGLISTNRIGQSNNQLGTFNNIGGIVAGGTTITSTIPVDYSAIGAGTYFRIGHAGDFAAGLYAIGPQASYAGYLATFASMTDAVSAITSVPLPGHVIFEFQSDYSPAVETFPIAFTPNIISSATSTITFRPSASTGLVNLSFAGTIINNTGADYIIFDGRPAGTGTNKYLQFTNTAATTPTVGLSGDAQYNQFLYCVVKGSNTTVANGIMSFTAPSTEGNSYNIISYCDFDGSTSAKNCLYTTGLATALTVSYNNFFNYMNGGGIYLTSGSENCIIDNNSFYQTVPYTGIAGTCYGIYIAGTGNNCQISNNNIGGSGPGLTGTWTVAATTVFAFNFTGMSITTGTTVASRVYNNKVQNFDWKTNSNGTWQGISLSGYNNAGTDGANYVGNNTSTGNILVTGYTAGTLTVRGMTVSGTNGFVENNIIGSITTAVNGAITVTTTLQGASYSGSMTMRNNIIGSATTAQSIQATSLSGANNISGINSSGSNSVITGNTIANIYNAGSGPVRGIENSNTGSTINYSNNNIFNLTATGTGAIVIGIYNGANNSIGTTMSGNTIYNLASTGTGNTSVYGIQFHSSDNGINNVMEKNLIHSFVTTSNTSVQIGINFTYGTAVTQNNAIRLGIDKDGNSITSSAQITGIYAAINRGCCVAPKFTYFDFNTVYIGGSGVVASAVKTYAFVLANHGNYGGSGLGEEIKNNIFVNMRTNAVANKQHYAISLPAISSVYWNYDYNIYQVSATDGLCALVANVDKSNIGALQDAYPGGNLNSGFGDPMLVLPTGTLATLDLHIQNFSPAEGNGVAVATVTDDLDGLERSTNTPTDIGAYAGNFTPAGPAQDIFYPIISFSPFGNASSTTGRLTYNFAAITDNFTGVDITSGTSPRIYYKLSTNANAFVGNTSADDGWKWVEAIGTTSPFDFNLDYSILFGGPVVQGSVIQYFVVAQDLATTPNVSFSPSDGASGISVGPTGMTAPATPLSYTIVPLLPQTFDVGTGYTYTTLTGSLASGGLFAAINGGVIDGNTVINIKTNITEPGTVGLNLVSEEGPNAGTLTLTIQSDGVAHLLSGGVATAAAPMIPINGAVRLNIDGGAGKLLTFRNTNATPANTGPVIQFNNSSQNCTLQNCYIESNATTQNIGAIMIGTTGINIITINLNDIRDARGGSIGSYSAGIYSNSLTNFVTITDNNIYNFKNPLGYVYSSGVYLNQVANGCIISGNSFFMESGVVPAGLQRVIQVNSGTGHTISDNFIGGQAPACGGGAYTFNSNSFTGIYITSTGAASTIQNNTIQNFSQTGTASAFYGIYSSASVVNVIGNTIGSLTIPNSIQLTGAGTSYAIYNSSNSTSPNTFDQNVVANVTLTAATGSPQFHALKMQGGNITRNKVLAIGASVAAATPLIYGINNSWGFTANEISNNMICLDGGNSTNPTLYGILESSTAGTTGFYYNSVNIYGTAGGTANSFAFYRSGSTAYTANNNILVNARTGGTGKHYAIYNTSATGFVSDNNDLYVAGPVLGYWPSADRADLAAWQAIAVVPPLDANSVSVAPAFTSNTDLHILADPNLQAIGIPVSVLIDIDGLARCTITPDPGINQFSPCSMLLNLTVYLEGLYLGGGMMNAVIDGNTGLPKWGAAVADLVDVDLHDPVTFAIIHHTINNVQVGIDGTANILVPGNFNGSYYISVHHRNSIETVTALPVSMVTPVVNYDFTNAAAQAYGNNMKQMPDSKWALYGGDENGDGAIDALDLIGVENDASTFAIGYILTDANGDGTVDALDLILVENNAFNFISVITP